MAFWREGELSPIQYIVRLAHWFKGHPVAVPFVGFCLLVEMGFNAFIPVAFSYLIDKGIQPRNSTVLTHALIALGIATLCAMGAGMAGDYVYAKLSARVLTRIRQQLFDHVQTLSPAFFQRYSAGDISARFSTDLAAVEGTLGSWLPWGWKPLFDLMGYNLVMFSVDWRLGLFAQLVWPMTLVGPRIFAPKAGAAAELRKAHESEMLNAVDEATAGRNVVRAFGLEATMSERFGGKLRKLANITVRGALFTSALERSASVGMYALQIAVLALGGWMAFKGAITIGGLVAFYTVFISASTSLYYLAQYSSSLINGAAGLARIESLLNERPAVPDQPGARDLPGFRRSILVRNCVYSPTPGRPILDDVSLTIKQGESVAFVGPSGSGKSTMLNAIMRFFDPDEGSIEIDGYDLRQVTRSSFVAQSAVVFQESFLFNASIKENLRLGRERATDAEIEQSCRDAEMHDVIMKMPGGYSAPVGERGSLLSGGQKQRLAIARALLRNPGILFLDEATSALDPATEVSINQTLERISRGRTVLFVTHRLASVLNCNRLFVMDHGRLAESGTHAELLAKNGLYASLWRKQEGIETSGDGAVAKISVARLKRLPMLASLSEEMLRELATSQFSTEHIPAFRDVVVQGDRGDRFYIIARGRVEVLQKDPGGSNRQVCLLEDGDLFGELALLRDIPRTATIRTLMDSTFLTLQRQQFQRLLSEAPEVKAAIYAQAEERWKAQGAV